MKNMLRCIYSLILDLDLETTIRVGIATPILRASGYISKVGDNFVKFNNADGNTTFFPYDEIIGSTLTVEYTDGMDEDDRILEKFLYKIKDCCCAGENCNNTRNNIAELLVNLKKISGPNQILEIILIGIDRQVRAQDLALTADEFSFYYETFTENTTFIEALVFGRNNAVSDITLIASQNNCQ